MLVALIAVTALVLIPLIGVYAAGDITTNSDNFWQLVTATSEGAVAAHSVYLDLKEGSKILIKFDLHAIGGKVITNMSS